MRWVAAGGIAVVLAGGTTAALLLRSPPKPLSPVIAGPAQATSGATLIVAGEAVQLDGIEAPPATLICHDGLWELKCGEDSRRALEQEIRNRPVECLRSGAAAKGVATAQCRNELGVDLAAALVEGGWAVVDLKRTSRYLPQQMRAQSESRGLWRNDFALAERWRLAGSTPGK